MKLEKVAAIAEIASSIAVVATLGYLAVQTQQNTAAIQATVRQGMLAEDRELMFKQMDYPFVMPGAYDSNALTTAETVQLTSWLIAFIRGRENQWLQYRNGVIDEDTWASYSYAIRVVLEPEFARGVWKQSAERQEFDSGFIAYVNELLGM